VSCQRLLTAVIAVVFVILSVVEPSVSIDGGIRSFGRPLLQASSSKQITLNCVPLLATLLSEGVVTSPITAQSDPLSTGQVTVSSSLSSNCDSSRAPPSVSL
jgi:hypothetical protein